MKLNKFFMAASLLVAGMTASAQETVTEYVFQPHWYGQLQIGGQETLGEGKFGKLLSPNAQIAIGYKFNPYIGMRLGVNAWQSKGVERIAGVNNGDNKYYRWCYVAPTVDAVVDMTNLIGGYNPTRLVEVDFLAGIGFNYAWHNGRAQGLYKQIHEVYNDPNLGTLKPWVHNNWSLVGQLGFGLNFNVSSRVQLGLEFTANVVNDIYNSKHAQNTDWYFNGLVGVGYAFGPRYETVTRVIEQPEPVVVEKIVEKIVEVPVAPPVVEQKKVEKEVFRRDVFFLINKYNIRPQEMEKVAQVAEYLNNHPNATVTITGYADKGTGSMAYNLRLSAQRSQAVAKALQTKYGIPASRMVVKSMGEDMYQPFPDAVQNRVAICIAE